MWDLEDFTKIRRWYALHLIMGVSFFVSSLIINAAQFLLYITIHPLNKMLYRKINYYLIYSIMSQILFVAEWWSESDVILHCTDEDFAVFGRESSLIVMNHTKEVDWLMGWIIADRFKILGAAKVFVKNMMKYVPTIGWAWSFSDIIFLKRNWQQDKNTFGNKISQLFNYPSPVWLLLFCEGTRFTPEKHAKSMKFARERGLSELKHLLIPRSRGFVECIRTMRGNFNAIYDVTMAFNTKDGADPTLRTMLKGQTVIADVYIRRIPLENIPLDDDKAADFLQQMYKEKDSLLDSYHNTGSYSEQSGFPSLPLQRFPRRYCSLINVLCWTCVVFVLIALPYYSLLTTGSLVANSIALTIIILAYIGLYKLIGLTKISKGSKYGYKTT